MNVDIDVKLRNEKHVDLYVFTKINFETLPASNNQISFKFNKKRKQTVVTNITVRFRMVYLT